MIKNGQLFKHSISHIIPSTGIKLIFWQLSSLKKHNNKRRYWFYILHHVNVYISVTIELTQVYWSTSSAHMSASLSAQLTTKALP